MFFFGIYFPRFSNNFVEIDVDNIVIWLVICLTKHTQSLWVVDIDIIFNKSTLAVL